MFKHWIVKRFYGAWLRESSLMTKKEALYLLNDSDVHCIEKVKGLFKGQIIYKYKKV